MSKLIILEISILLKEKENIKIRGKETEIVIKEIRRNATCHAKSKGHYGSRTRYYKYPCCE